MPPLLQPSAMAVFLASKGLGPYIRQHFLDKTFQGLYQVNAFDLALLIPYFIVLIILAAYGGHRYWLVYLYYKKRKNKTTDPPGYFEDLPRVTVQLPIFNEQYVVDRLARCRLPTRLSARKARYPTARRLDRRDHRGRARARSTAMPRSDIQ